LFKIHCVYHACVCVLLIDGQTAGPIGTKSDAWVHLYAYPGNV